jgi:hypothetical protein
MNKMKKLAVAVLAVAALSGCASAQIADLARADGMKPQAEEAKVSRPLPAYGYMGGYRYRRLAAVTVAG